MTEAYIPRTENQAWCALKLQPRRTADNIPSTYIQVTQLGYVYVCIYVYMYVHPCRNVCHIVTLYPRNVMVSRPQGPGRSCHWLGHVRGEEGGSTLDDIDDD